MTDDRTDAERAETDRMAGFFEEFQTVDHAEAEAWVWEPLRSGEVRYVRWTGRGSPLRWERPRIVSTRPTAAGTPRPAPDDP